MTTQSEQFGREYYDSIWGTVHRHDYVDDICNKLEIKYGKCRVLDVGTGCGFLVKTLRERGFDAWGCEVSNYALENTCCPGYVVKGAAENLPFKDGSFDVIFSSGVLEYVSEENVPAMCAELNRVGLHQEHNIDVPPHSYYRSDFKTFKPWEWWEEQLKGPKILLTCPTHECKEYAHGRWIDNVKKLDWPHFDICVIDNSPTLDCFNRWKDKIPMEHINVQGDGPQRIAASMEVLRQKFLAGNYRWWFNLEIDVIPPPGIIKLLLKYGQDSDWFGHVYPARGSGDDAMSGIGCSMFSRKLMEDYCFTGTGDSKGVDAYFWDHIRPMRKYKVMELWGYMPVTHLAS